MEFSVSYHEAPGNPIFMRIVGLKVSCAKKPHGYCLRTTFIKSVKDTFPTMDKETGIDVCY